MIQSSFARSWTPPSAVSLRVSFRAPLASSTRAWSTNTTIISRRSHIGSSNAVRGEIRRLIITVPPRHLKSLCVSIAYPAFLLGHDPTRRIIAASYSSELAEKSKPAVSWGGWKP